MKMHPILSNCIFMIEPKRSVSGVWTFTDPAVNIVNEPFVGSTNHILDYYSEGASEMTLMFSALPFPGHTMSFEKVPGSGGLGATYFDTVTKIAGWLCPALFKYFETAPDYIFARIYKHEDDTHNVSPVSLPSGGMHQPV